MKNNVQMIIDTSRIIAFFLKEVSNLLLSFRFFCFSSCLILSNKLKFDSDILNGLFVHTKIRFYLNFNHEYIGKSVECFYIKELDQESKSYLLDESQSNHAKVLRIKSNEICSATNGKGINADGYILIEGKNYKFIVKNYHLFQNELKLDITLCFSLLNNKDRQDFLIEKAVELGVKAIIPIRSTYSQIGRLNLPKTELKLITALKQSKRSVLPKLREVTTLEKIDFNSYDCIFLADIDGKKFENTSLKGNVLLLVGPEGGFNSKEVDYFSSKSAQKINLGNSRLRAETAAITLLSLIRNCNVSN